VYLIFNTLFGLLSQARQAACLSFRPDRACLLGQDQGMLMVV
jgi:hypothetical protein